MKCAFCDEPASDYEASSPVMCEKHLDLAVLGSYLARQGTSPTVETVTALLARARANNGHLTVTEADIESMLAPPFTELFDKNHSTEVKR